MEPILGIDLGTTNSVVAVVDGGKVRVLEEAGQAILPSVVGLDDRGELLVGSPARNQFVLAPERTVRSIKRRMGDDATVSLGTQQYSPQEISAIILRTLKERAERQFGQPLRRAVITVPAFFSEIQREATREAGELAGLEVVRIINEPTAAALTYEPHPTAMERLLVYDLGGGTFDVSVVQVEQGVVEVLASHGDTHLGGDDFDQLLLDFVCDRFQEQHDIDLRQSLLTHSRVLHAVEEAKKRLSDEAIVTIAEEFIAEKDGVPLHLEIEIARPEYEDLIEPLLEKTLHLLDESLTDAHLQVTQIDKIILVGGASRTPLVHRLLHQRLGQPVHSELNPDLCVAMGAAVQGALIAGVDVGPVLVDITPHTLGIQALGYVHGQYTENSFSPIIERNSPLPITRTEIYSTASDGQREAMISVFQGDDEDVRYNHKVGEFLLAGLADVESGNEVLVRFSLDLDGILKIAATERATGLEKRLVINNSVERFRQQNRQAAADRLNRLLGAPQVISSEESTDSSATSFASPALQQVLLEARDLILKAKKLKGQSNLEDAEELRQLVDSLSESVVSGSEDEIRDRMAKLEDLVFYLADAE